MIHQYHVFKFDTQCKRTLQVKTNLYEVYKIYSTMKKTLIFVITLLILTDIIHSNVIFTDEQMNQLLTNIQTASQKGKNTNTNTGFVDPTQNGGSSWNNPSAGGKLKGDKTTTGYVDPNQNGGSSWTKPANGGKLKGDNVTTGYVDPTQTGGSSWTNPANGGKLKGDNVTTGYVDPNQNGGSSWNNPSAGGKLKGDNNLGDLGFSSQELTQLLVLLLKAKSVNLF